MTFREFTLCVNLSNFIFSLFQQVVVKGYTHILIYRGKKPLAHNVLSRITKRTASLNVYLCCFRKVSYAP